MMATLLLRFEFKGILEGQYPKEWTAAAKELKAEIKNDVQPEYTVTTLEHTHEKKCLF